MTTLQGQFKVLTQLQCDAYCIQFKLQSTSNKNTQSQIVITVACDRLSMHHISLHIIIYHFISIRSSIHFQFKEWNEEKITNTNSSM